MDFWNWDHVKKQGNNMSADTATERCKLEKATIALLASMKVASSAISSARDAVGY